MSRLLFLGCLAYLTIGLGQLVLGAVMEPMVNAYGIRYGDGGQLVMNQFLGGLAGTLCAPWLIGRIGRKSLLLAAFAIMAIIEGMYLALPPWGVMLTIAPITGFGFGIVEALVGSLIIGGAGDKANHAMTRVETFFGIGALIIPFAGAALIEIGQWRMAFGVVALLSAASLVCWLRLWPAGLGHAAEAAAASHEKAGHGTASHGADEHGGFGAGPAGSVVHAARIMRTGSQWIVMIACLLFFVVYVGLEMSFVHYLPSVLVHTGGGVTEATATLALSVFWGAMTLGRFAAGSVADRFGGGAYLLSTCAFAAVCFGLMSLTGGVTAMFVLTFFAGLALSGIFAVALVFTNRAVPGTTEQTTSLLIASGLLGGAILPKLAGWTLDRFEVGTTRWLFTAVTVLMVVIMGVAVAYAKRSARTAVVLE